jgi:hypothetical protein
MCMRLVCLGEWRVRAQCWNKSSVLAAYTRGSKHNIIQQRSNVQYTGMVNLALSLSTASVMHRSDPTRGCALSV